MFLRRSLLDEDLVSGLLDISPFLLGIFVAREDQTLEDVGICLEGQIVIRDLDNVSLAFAMLIGLFYALNLSYPKSFQYLKYTKKCHNVEDPNIKMKSVIFI
uniref:Uncharacterized protein n=1 Tax=Oryzias latipes TaxID=8090 RepID=A0A3P9I6W7_ORYLA